MRNILIFVSLFFIGCSLKPDMPVPEIKGEFRYRYESFNINNSWWQDFHDENLNKLINLALKNNSNLILANLNLQKAKATLELRNKDFLPTLSASFNAQRQGSSGENFGKRQRSTYNGFSLSGILNYEVDLWGRVENLSNAANASFKASVYDLQSAKLTISSTVAKTYFQLIALNFQKEVLLEAVQTYTKTANYRKNQLDAGAISKIIYIQSLSELNSAKVRLNDIQKAFDLTNATLSNLTNANLNDILYKNAEFTNKFPREPEIPQGVSADILLKRPDVASAYEKIKIANFMIGVSKTAYFPKLSLTGMFGFQSNELDSFLVSNATAWSLGGQLVGNVFDFGRTKKNIEISQIDENISIANYDKVLKDSLFEVRNSLNNRKIAKEKFENINILKQNQEEIYNLANNRFETGYSSHLELLDAQRALLSVKLQVINSYLEMINSMVDIYKSFGGGFSTKDSLN